MIDPLAGGETLRESLEHHWGLARVAAIPKAE